MTDTTSFSCAHSINPQALKSVKNMEALGQSYGFPGRYSSPPKTVAREITPEKRTVQAALWSFSSGIVSVLMLTNQTLGCPDTSKILPQTAQALLDTSSKGTHPEVVADFIDPPTFYWNESVYSAIKASEEFTEPLYASH